jgi:hypothetical protein
LDWREPRGLVQQNLICSDVVDPDTTYRDQLGRTRHQGADARPIASATSTRRLTEGVDVYFLSKKMGTSVKMIEDHYGHVSPVKNAERTLLQGLPGWEPISAMDKLPKATEQTMCRRSGGERSRVDKPAITVERQLPENSDDWLDWPSFGNHLAATRCNR